MERQKRTDKQSKKTQVKEPARRRKPGSSGTGDYFHVEVRPGEKFVSFRTQDMGRRGQIQRVAGQRFSGYWTTVKWLIGKEEAHIQDAKLVPDTKAAKEVIEQLGSQPVHWLGDRFKAKPDPNAPESTDLTVNKKGASSGKAPMKRRKK
ncbi:MAG: hypothetical protein ABIU06_06065 [Anaerolineales bacterium]